MVSNAQRNQEIATNFSLWGEYVDPDATMSEREFDALGIDERLKLMDGAFPEEAGEDDSSLFSPRNIDQVKRKDETMETTVIAIDNDMVDRGIDGLHDAADINFAGDMDWKGMMRAGLTAALDSRYFEADGHDDILSALKSAEALVDYIRGHKGNISDDVLDEWAGRVAAEIRPILANIDAEEGVDTGTR